MKEGSYRACPLDGYNVWNHWRELCRKWVVENNWEPTFKVGDFVKTKRYGNMVIVQVDTKCGFYTACEGDSIPHTIRGYMLPWTDILPRDKNNLK